MNPLPTWFDWYHCLHKIAYVPKYQPQTYIHREYRFPFENKYFNRAVSLAIRRAVGERSMLATATTNAKTSTAATTNAETERSFVALVVIILTATRHLARRLVPRSNEPTNKPTNERTNHRTNQRTNEGTNTTNERTNDGQICRVPIGFCRQKMQSNQKLLRDKDTHDVRPRSPVRQDADGNDRLHRLCRQI